MELEVTCLMTDGFRWLVAQAEGRSDCVVSGENRGIAFVRHATVEVKETRGREIGSIA